MKSDRFKKRREKLRAKRLCTRCGESKARPRHCTCAVCAAVMAVKDEQRRKTNEKRAAAIRRKLLLFESATSALQVELHRITSAA